MFNAPKKEIQMYEKEELHWNSTSSLSARPLPVFPRHLTSLCGILLCLVFYVTPTTVWLYRSIYQVAKKIVLESCHLNSNQWPLAEIFQRLSFFCLMIKGCQSIIFLWFWWNCLWIVIITRKTSLFCETSAFVAHSARKIPWIRLNDWWLLKSFLTTRRPVLNMSCIQGRGFFSKIKYSSFWKHR